MRILRGACDGLAVLNLRLRILHLAVRAEHILVDVGDDGRPTGIIGSLERVLFLPLRAASEGDAPAPLRREPCDPTVEIFDGHAPFAHCDARRDLMAMMFVCLDTLSGHSWAQFVRDGFPNAEQRLRFGVANGPDGKPPGSNEDWRHGDVLFRYAAAVHSSDRVAHPVPADLLKLLDAFLDPTATDGGSTWQSSAKKADDVAAYRKVHRRMRAALLPPPTSSSSSIV